MRRTAFIFCLALVLGVVWALPALAREGKTTSSTSFAARRASAVGKEPAAIYGWAVVKDPRTAKRWTPGMYPSVKVHFVNRKTGRKEMVFFGDGSVAKLESRYNTWRYYIKFEHDTNFKNQPGPEGSRATVKYNPQEYRFSHLDVYFRKIERVEGGTRTLWQIDCARQSHPLRDLPDMAQPTWR